MLVAIPNVLTSAQVAEARQLLDSAEWIDGKATAGHQGIAILGGARLKRAKIEKIAPHGHTTRLRRSDRHRSRRRGAGREAPATANHRWMNRKNRPCLCEQEGGYGGGGGI